MVLLCKSSYTTVSSNTIWICYCGVISSELVDTLLFPIVVVEILPECFNMQVAPAAKLLR